MWKVSDKTQNITGFWGDVDTTTNFCEPHYAVSPYFAEFFNAWTSLVYVFVGSYVLLKLSMDTFSKIAGIWLIVIGVGSFLFHGTMRYTMQLIDELPMVGFILTICLAKSTSTHHTGMMKASRYIQTWICFLAVAVVSAYSYFDVYEIFLHGFSVMVLSDIAVGHVLKTVGPNIELKKTAVTYALLFLFLGRAVWEVENQTCRMHPYVWPLHAVWHFLSALSAYNGVIYAFLCRLDGETQLPAVVESRRKIRSD